MSLTPQDEPRDKLIIDVVSDVMCPWCYIGKRRLARAIVMCGPEFEAEIRWRPFQLDATIPPEGMDRQEYLDRKFGRERAAENYKRIQEVGAMEGIPFAFDHIARSPNTLDAHRLIRWAATGDQQDAVVERLFALYFTEGADIGDHDVLIGVSREADMDVDLVAEMIASETDRDKVQEEIELAQQLGVEGVPTFVIASRYMLVGAQPAENLAEALAQISQAPPEEEEDDMPF